MKTNGTATKHTLTVLLIAPRDALPAVAADNTPQAHIEVVRLPRNPTTEE